MEAVPDAPSTPPRPAPVLVSTPQVVMGSAAPAVAREPNWKQSRAQPKATANTDDVRSAVLNALDSAGLTMLSSMLAAGEW